jgi:hypothetical protein
MFPIIQKIFFFSFLLASLSLVPAQNLSTHIANYTITARLLPQTKTIQGSETIVWYNKTTDAVPNLQLHLYMNAFKGPHTTFMQKRGQSARFGYSKNNKNWGSIVIERLQTQNRIDLIKEKRFIQPDDSNTEDETVVEVILPQEVLPGDSLVIVIDFRVNLPEIIARTGYRNNFFMIGQWFPKLGVYEQGRGWNCHQFHANSEFYADFGVYDVTIQLPQEYMVGATGIQISQEMIDDSTKSLRYLAKDVHDFAWAADPEFEVITDKWQDITICFLAQPAHRMHIDRQIAALKHAFTYCNEWYGVYPYSQLTVIDPPDDAQQAGGMEYPTLITAGFMYDIFNSFHFMEEVVVHEFCHQYWYGIVANNEFEEAWLDEGFTTYSEMKIIDSFYIGSIDILNFRLLNREITWLKYALGNPNQDRIVKNAWEYQLGGYYMFSYNKPALMLLTLENFIGRETMRIFLKKYFECFRFKHVTTRDFISTFCEVAGYEWQSFLEQLLYKTGDIDYRLYSLTNRISSDSAKIEKYNSKVVVFREGEVSCPVEIVTFFEDGSKRSEIWDGKERYHIFSYTVPVPALYAEVDPEHKNWLDSNRLNNSKNAKTDNQITASIHNLLLFWMQNLLGILIYFN